MELDNALGTVWDPREEKTQGGHPQVGGTDLRPELPDDDIPSGRLGRFGLLAQFDDAGTVAVDREAVHGHADDEAVGSHLINPLTEALEVERLDRNGLPVVQPVLGSIPVRPRRWRL